MSANRNGLSSFSRIDLAKSNPRHLNPGDALAHTPPLFFPPPRHLPPRERLDPLVKSGQKITLK